MNRFSATVEPFSAGDSFAWLRLSGKGRLAARLWPGICAGEKTTVRVSPDDVVLCENHPGRSSARNLLPGHVTAVKLLSDGARVELDVGFPLTAIVTRAAVADLRLRRGTAIFAMVKAGAVKPDVTLEAGVRVSLTGVHGVVGYEHLDFLRLIEQTGTLAAAAQQRSVNYRTAWMWTQAMNRAWGKPLIARSKGGRGGGMCLTTDGRAALALADAVERGGERPNS